MASRRLSPCPPSHCSDRFRLAPRPPLPSLRPRRCLLFLWGLLPELRAAPTGICWMMCPASWASTSSFSSLPGATLLSLPSPAAPTFPCSARQMSDESRRLPPPEPPPRPPSPASAVAQARSCRRAAPRAPRRSPSTPAPEATAHEGMRVLGPRS